MVYRFQNEYYVLLNNKWKQVFMPVLIFLDCERNSWGGGGQNKTDFLRNNK